MADIDDFDIDRSIAQAWAEFQARLSDIVSMIDDSADLTIGTGSASDDPAPYLRLSSPRPHLVRGEAASNAVLGEDFQLRPISWPPWSGWAGSRRHATTRRRGEFLARAAPGRGRQDQRAGRLRAAGRVRGAAPDLPGARSAGRSAPADADADRGPVRVGPPPILRRTAPSAPRRRTRPCPQSASPGGAGRCRAGRHVRLPADPRRRRGHRHPGRLDDAVSAGRYPTARR